MKVIKSKETLKRGEFKLPLYEANKKSVIDVLNYIPVVSGKKQTGDKIKLLRRADLLPKNVRFAPAAVRGIGAQMLDSFSPQYGSYYPVGTPHFRFLESQLIFTSAAVWFMRVAPSESSQEHLRFRIDPPGGNYVKVLLGQTGDVATESSILEVTVNGNSFLIDTYPLSFQHFDFYLESSDAGWEIEFALNLSLNANKRAYCSVSGVEIYNKILVARPQSEYFEMMQI